MEEEFYATIKLISGEEIISKICYISDEDKILLDNPLEVENAKHRKGNLEVSGFSLKEWITASFDEMYIINMSHVLTIIELDETIQEFYKKTLKRIHNSKNLNSKEKLPRRAGYLGSIKEMKQSLEDLYKKS